LRDARRGGPVAVGVGLAIVVARARGGARAVRALHQDAGQVRRRVAGAAAVAQVLRRGVADAVRRQAHGVLRVPPAGARAVAGAVAIAARHAVVGAVVARIGARGDEAAGAVRGEPGVVLEAGLAGLVA